MTYPIGWTRNITRGCHFYHYHLDERMESYAAIGPDRVVTFDMNCCKIRIFCDLIDHRLHITERYNDDRRY